MNRKNFLKSAGVLGAASILPISNGLTKSLEASVGGGACSLIPSETEGPFPLDLSANTYYFRNDVKETKTGTSLKLKLKIIGLSNCLPLQNVRVNIWHCDKDGLYSGYDNNMNKGQAGLTYCRGYQITDVNGEVNFNTIFPGWYNGRIAHIHFKISVSSSYSAVSQLTWDIAKKNALYAENPLYLKGADPLTYNSDNIFSDGHTLQIGTLDKNADGSYSSYLEVFVQGTGTTAISHVEKQNSKYFTLGQNYPNPVITECAIPFELYQKSNVKITLWSEQGQLVKEILSGGFSEGKHQCIVNLNKCNLAKQNYAYQIEVTNQDGIFIDSKLMSVLV